MRICYLCRQPDAALDQLRRRAGYLHQRRLELATGWLAALSNFNRSFD